MAAGPRRGGQRVVSVVLVGPRGAGKSTLAPPLAERLGWDAADTDLQIAERVGRPAWQLLGEAGEAEFRRVETAVVGAALRANRRRVLALGGGAVLAPSTRRELVDGGHFVVFLCAPVAVLVERQVAGPPRPRLTERPVAEEVAHLLALRLPLYRAVCDLTLDTFSSNIHTCLASILANMGGHGE
ncbi:MAG: shikimate kinase [Planctomycetes bacterium]|nr:shikimate kinase [Planctomycetota bacterium]